LELVDIARGFVFALQELRNKV